MRDPTPSPSTRNVVNRSPAISCSAPFPFLGASMQHTLLRKPPAILKITKKLVVDIRGGFFSGARQQTLGLRLGSTALLQKKNSPPNIHMINCSQSDLSYKTNKGKLKKLHIFSVNRKYESINNSFNNRYHSDFSKQSDSPDCYNILLQSTHRTLSWCSCYQNQNS